MITPLLLVSAIAGLTPFEAAFEPRPVGEGEAREQREARADAIRIEAYIDADSIEVGGSYDLRIEIAYPPAVVASKAGAPAPFLQIDAPPSVKLTGRTLTTYEELAANEFLMEPYERLIEGTDATIPFDLVAAPADGERMGLNIVAYVSSGDGEEPFFLRRRLELPMVAGEDAIIATEPKSDWGTDDQLLQIGDTVEALALPNESGEAVDLGQWIGEKNIIVSTYRAHW